MSEPLACFHPSHRLPPALQIDVLQAEVQALKTLVLSSPTSPLGELPSAGSGAKTPFRKGHSRNKSTSSAMMGTQPDPAATQPIVRECREVSPRGDVFKDRRRDGNL